MARHEDLDTLSQQPTAFAFAERATPHLVDPRPATRDDDGHAARYELGTLLGQGGMGEVRLCRDRHVGRDVAMKVISAEHAHNLDARDRFLREARLQGQLEHPAIVPVYDIAFNREGASHFTMKRIAGRTLGQVIEALSRNDPDAVARYSLRKLLTAFGSVCQAIEFAHRRGVIHRDLKPDNLMLGADGEVYVLDWGVARARGHEDAPAPRAAPEAPTRARARTQQGAIVGTFGFMPPEQLRGEADAVGPRSDVYALGAVLFELLTLTPLHPLTSHEALVTSTLSGADARASVRAPARDIAPELDALCVKATALDPADRFASAHALYEGIERYLDGARDLALRQTLADGHADRAEGLAKIAHGDTREALRAREEALREVGRAVALMPDHPRALATLLGLLLRPPREMPPEAEAAFDANVVAQVRAAARSAGYAFLSWLALLPLVLWMGVRDLACLAWLVATIAAAAGLSFFTAAQARPSATLQTAMMLAGNVAALSTYPLFGSWVLLPSLVTANAVLFSISPNGARWRLSALVAALGFTALVGLEALGVLPPRSTLDGDALHVRAQMTRLDPLPSQVFLVVIHLGVIGTATALMERFRRSLCEAERQLRLHAWQLKSLAPLPVNAAEVSNPGA
ncbi:MAG: serine/threonine protein kinase [Myxococcales bacterium]|nr:serine/threonine protein kinase [Myxococcales bacterium]